MSSKSIPPTPYMLWNGAKPNLENLWPWGCIGYVHNTSHRCKKLDPRTIKNVLIRYFDYLKG